MAGDEIKNYEVTLSQIRGETKGAASHLSSVYEDTRKAEEARDKAIAVTEEQKIVLENVRKEQEEIESKKALFPIEKKKHLSELNLIEESKKNSLKELKQLNSWILKAEDVKKENELELKKQDIRIAEKKPLVLETLKIEDEIAALRNKKKEIVEEGKAAVRESNDEISLLQSSIKELEERKKSLVGEVSALEVKKKYLDDQYSLKTSDLAEYTYRVKIAYEKMFGRNMPVLK